MSLLLTLNIFHTLFSVSIVNFEQINADWDYLEIVFEVFSIESWHSKQKNSLLLGDQYSACALLVGFTILMNPLISRLSL